jgi:hypothetical protein
MSSARIARTGLLERLPRRLLGAASALLLALSGIAVLAPVAARADTAPVNALPATVSADALPTVQVNGVVWAQVTVGNTVYATGSFTSARPAGSVAGVNETARKNILAYDITTGKLITTFSHSMNAQGMVVSASPDGSRIYVGGDFTSVDGLARGHIAAFATATGALVTTFAPSANARVAAIAATSTTVYAGGSFTAVGATTRTRLAAFNVPNGALLNWAPRADDNTVTAMVLSPLGKVIVGGRFSTLNSVSALGLGALDPVSGATLPWAANQRVQDSGASAGITSLRSDGTQIYGTGFVFGPGGNLEGTFAANPETGAINWLEDCHGDTYDSFSTGPVTYVVSHEHFCGNIGAFPQTNPWTFYRATAFTSYPTGTVAHNSIGGYADWYGTPDPTQLDWYPTLTTGTYTGQNQAAWSATGNSQYIALGGEFPTVNGTAQQSLVRFAIRSIAPNLAGPRPATTLTPSLVSLSGGTMRVGWQATFDQDNQALTYKVVRDGKTATPVYNSTINSTFYQRPSLGFTDTGLTPGTTHSYRVYVTDPLGNQMTGSTVTATVGSATAGTYAADVVADGASDFWRLGELAGSTGYDWAGYNDVVEQANVGHGAPGAIAGDSDNASIFAGPSAGTATSTATAPGPDNFTIEAWFKTTSTSGGKIVGYGDAATGTSSSYDRQVYLDNADHLVFGVFDGNTEILASTRTYNDGSYHQVVASLSAAGMAFYVDGKKVGTRSTPTAGQAYTGYWRIGGDNLAGWPAQPASNFFAGTIDDVAIYPAALTVTQIQKHFTDSGRSLGLPATPTDALGKAVMADSPDTYWRLDEASGLTAADQSGNGVLGNYLDGVSYRTPSTVTPAGTGVTLNGSTGLIVSQNAVNDPTVYSEELWFNTTTTSGGKLIGFGNAATGESSSYDRHVYLLDSGQLEFGAWTGQANLATSTASYNDGNWHQLVASQGPSGMILYVDGQSVATNPQTQAQAYTGYWRVGGDHVWAGSSDFFNGSIDEVSIYSTQLAPGRVLAQYQAADLNAGKQPPTAAFTPRCSYLACTFDASTSSDPNPGGTVSSYAWQFGDGSTGTGAKPSHIFAAGGAYTVSLAVTDDRGAASTSATQSIAVTAIVIPLATDTFNRTVSGGLGTADKGGAWASLGTAANLSVAPGAAALRMPAAGGQAAAYLPGVKSTAVEADVTFTTDKLPSSAGVYFYLSGRRVATNNEYQARIRIAGSHVYLALYKLAGNSTETVIGTETLLPGVTYSAGMRLSARLQVSGTGTTNLALKVWQAGTVEPASWTVTNTDTTAGLQVAGSVGLTSYLSGTATNAPIVLKVSAVTALPKA